MNAFAQFDSPHPDLPTVYSIVIHDRLAIDQDA